MNVAIRACVLLLAVGAAPRPVVAQDGRWGSPDDAIVKTMIGAERMWAQSSCAPQPKLKDIIADDFQGTSTAGKRFRKGEAIETDTTRLDRDCQLGEVKVQFFGDSIAVAYGSESRLRKGEDGKESKRCQVWTDTWLKRQGKWQIVAAQDNVVPCQAMP
jgi:hypothetical protein